MYIHKQFNYSFKIVRFLNDEGIDKEDIITIYSDGVMHHLVYLKREI